MADSTGTIDDIATCVAAKLGFVLKDKQREVISSFVKGSDVMAILPTGYGKSLCYTILPMIFDDLRSDGLNSIILIITPLTAIIRDQVRIVI